MTNSEEELFGASSGPTEKLSLSSSTKKNISKNIEELLKRKDDTFNFSSETEDLEELADEIFDALYYHTLKQNEDTSSDSQST